MTYMTASLLGWIDVVDSKVRRSSKLATDWNKKRCGKGMGTSLNHMARRSARAGKSNDRF